MSILKKIIFSEFQMKNQQSSQIERNTNFSQSRNNYLISNQSQFKRNQPVVGQLLERKKFRGPP